MKRGRRQAVGHQQSNIKSERESVVTTSGEVSMDVFKALVSRAGMDLTDEELAELKEAYDVFQPGVDNLHNAQLGAEDLAVSFEPVWDPEV
jgi:hypothetical protein